MEDQVNQYLRWADEEGSVMFALIALVYAVREVTTELSELRYELRKK